MVQSWHGQQCRFIELVAYYIYHLENRTEVTPWRDVTPEMVAKYEAFSKRCMEDYAKKMNEPNRVFVEQKK